jgi:hypothetical protein
MTGSIISRTLCSVALGLAVLASHAAAAEFDQSHALFDVVLKQRVKNARVDYAGLKAHPQDLNRYLDQVAGVSKTEFKKWSEPQQIAFLSNAYNAYTLRLIIDHYPLRRIKDIGSIFSGPWDQPVVRLFGGTMDLNTVEHRILRKDYTEPRLHFVLVCAAKGCPPLRGEAYVGARLEAQLVDQAKQFLAESAKNRVDAATRTVYLSPIFKWYGSDFEKKHGSVLAALKPDWPGKSVAGYEEFKIRYTEYNWSLNEQPRK